MGGKVQRPLILMFTCLLLVPLKDPPMVSARAKVNLRESDHARIIRRDSTASAYIITLSRFVIRDDAASRAVLH